MAKAKAKPRGRPRSVMTDEVIDKILRTIELGVWPDRAAQMHGVSGASLRSHKARHADFATLIEKAEAKAESSIHGKILLHMDKQWTAAAWMLERRFPERYAKREMPAVEAQHEPDPRFD